MSITVVIPTMGRSTLMRAIASALKVDGVRNVIVVTDKYFKPSIESYDARIKFDSISLTDACSKRNHGLRLTVTQYVIFLDDDDELCLENIADFSSILQDDNCAGLVYNAKLVRENSTRIIRKAQDKITWNSILFKNVIGTTSSVVLSTKVLAENNIWFDPENTCRQDFDLWLRILSVQSKYFYGTGTVGLIYHDSADVDRISKQKIYLKIKSLLLQYYRHCEIKKIYVLTIINQLRYLISSLVN